ncbi:hypothetical protein [Pelotalea chapellei]|uniref:Uncharacterized protein n=1 Tax=Pelotalea chapellei TaxID=44671 RepID=A0ABS5U5D6_9BACT|nr:hypothetical protein [Pelotalea chapellei]MBT1070882.1 hypothetical protein [Pelotalea chapellei]
MVNGVSGSNLATSMREMDHVTPQTQHQSMATATHLAQQSVVQAKTDTVTFSKAALDKSKKAEKFKKPAGNTEQPVPQKPRGK